MWKRIKLNLNYIKELWIRSDFTIKNISKYKEQRAYRHKTQVRQVRPVTEKVSQGLSGFMRETKEFLILDNLVHYSKIVLL